MQGKIPRAACKGQSHPSRSTAASSMPRDKMVSQDWLRECAIQVQTRLRHKLRLEDEIAFLAVRHQNCLLPLLLSSSVAMVSLHHRGSLPAAVTFSSHRPLTPPQEPPKVLLSAGVRVKLRITVASSVRRCHLTQYC